MKGIWVPVSAAVAQQNRVDTIANNIANANTAGFKRDRLVFKEHLTALNKGLEDIDLPRKEWAPRDFYRSEGGGKAHVKVAASFTIFEQGPLTPTGNPLDVGVSGKGFIRVLGSNGIRHTRKGNLSVSKDGFLTTDRGFLVLGKPTGDRLELNEGIEEQSRNITSLLAEEKAVQLEPGKVTINLQGDVFVNGDPIARISMVEFKDASALRKEGNSLFVNHENENLIVGGKVKSTIHQGFIEQSNVSAVGEMSELIKANRHFETIQRAIKSYNHITGRAVNDILKF